MFDAALSSLLKRIGARPCLRVYGKARHESDWRVIDVAASPRRNFRSRWPLMRGACITLTSSLIVVGWDFARGFMASVMIGLVVLLALLPDESRAWMRPAIVGSVLIGLLIVNTLAESIYTLLRYRRARS